MNTSMNTSYLTNSIQTRISNLSSIKKNMWISQQRPLSAQNGSTSGVTTTPTLKNKNIQLIKNRTPLFYHGSPMTRSSGGSRRGFAVESGEGKSAPTPKGAVLLPAVTKSLIIINFFKKES